MLKISIPVVRVIDQLNDARDRGSEVDLGGLIRTLSDSLALLGAGNQKKVQRRR